MKFNKEQYWARRRNKTEYTLESGRKVLLDKPLRGQGDEVKPRGKLVPSVSNRASERAKSVDRTFTKKGFSFGRKMRVAR